MTGRGIPGGYSDSVIRSMRCLLSVGRKQRTQAGTDAGPSTRCLLHMLWSLPLAPCLLLDKWISHPEGSTVFQNTCRGRDILDPIHNK